MEKQRRQLLKVKINLLSDLSAAQNNNDGPRPGRGAPTSGLRSTPATQHTRNQPHILSSTTASKTWLKTGKSFIPVADSKARHTYQNMNRTIQARNVDAFHAEVLQTTSLKERKSDGFAKHQGDLQASPQLHAGILGGFPSESASFRPEQSPRTAAHSRLRLSHKAFEVLWRKTSPAKMA